MNKWSKKVTALLLCAALCLGGVGYAFAQNATQPQGDTAVQTPQQTAADSASALSKDETVYVLAGADGAVEKIIVSDWIQNALGSETIEDASDLEGIQTVRGDQRYTLDGAHMKVWDAKGDDIYYQGSIEKELPVALSVSYRLNGRAVSAQELAGQSGRVTIRFDYENRQYQLVDIDGRQERIYVPFALLTGLLLDNDSFRNVEVSNGKLINDGDRCIVAGLAFPGLQEDLGLSRDTLDIPDYVEITADVTDFQLGMSITLATNEPFSGLEAGQLEDAAGLQGSLTQLTDAMAQLLDGSSALYDGLCTLLEKSGQLVSGVEQLAAGAQTLLTGAGSLEAGAQQLQVGLAQLSEGLGTLSENSASLNSGALQVFNILLSTATQQLRAAGLDCPDLTPENYAEVLGALIASLDEEAVYQRALEQVTAAVEARRPEITEQVTSAVYEQVFQAVAGMSRADYEAAVAAGLITPEQQALIEATVAQQMASPEVQTLIAQQVELQVQQAIAQAMSSEAVQAQLAAAAAGAQSVIALKTSLDSYNAFYLGLLSYTAGVDSAALGASELTEGSATLSAGMSQLRLGLSQLYDGVLTLRDGAPALVDGVTALRDGAMQLSDGLRQFNEQGVQKLVELLDGDLAGLGSRLQATLDVSRGYCSFSGLSDDMDGQVKFIYRTDEIKPASEN